MKYMNGYFMDKFWEASERWHCALGFQGKGYVEEHVDKYIIDITDVQCVQCLQCLELVSGVMNRVSRVETLLNTLINMVEKQFMNNGAGALVSKKRRLASQ